MKKLSKYPKQLSDLCRTVRTLCRKREYEESIKLICELMGIYPNAPHPHNLLGLVLEFQGDHASAMNHFRAAWALDSSYLPAKYNLETYGTFLSHGACAFDESDIKKIRKY